MNPTHKIMIKISGVYSFYRDGFQAMNLGKQLWKIILIKLFVMFAILKLFFFPNFLNTNFETDEEKSSYVLEQMTRNSTIKDIKTIDNYQEEK